MRHREAKAVSEAPEHFRIMDIAHLHDIFLECGSKVVTDSRKIEKGCMFFALKGENFDGNDFAWDALEQGAAWCVVSEDSKPALEARSGGVPGKGAFRLLAVPDTLKALQDLATYHRENTLHNGKRIPMLAITGTNGKTTTKELIHAALSAKYDVMATQGNLNNNIGVPLTLLTITEKTRIAIVEMGASHPGDIRELVGIAHPDFGLITNVGRAHLLGFGSFDGVKATKGELYDYIAATGGCCFVNLSLKELADMAESRHGMKIIPYGPEHDGARTMPQDADHPFLRLSVGNGEYEVNTNLVGNYNADNVLAALAVARHFGVETEDAARAIGAYVPSNRRSQMVRTPDKVLILDAYNANPSSMAVALDNFADFSAGRKAAFLGDMRELGAESAAEHRKILRKVHDELNPEIAVLVGEEFSAANNELGYGYACFPTSDAAAAFVAGLSLSGYAILVKGSRGIKMENILNSL